MVRWLLLLLAVGEPVTARLPVVPEAPLGSDLETVDPERPRWDLVLEDEVLAVRFQPLCRGIAQRQEGTKSLVVSAHGVLVCQEHHLGGALTQPTNVKSASKSVLSLLVGIAVDEGLMRLDQPAADLVPELRDPRDPRKETIQIRDLLQMSSGLRSTSFENYGGWVVAANQVRAAAGVPLVAEPGTELRYSTGTTHLLSAAVSRAAGLPTAVFARRLFEPLGIRPGGWQTDRQGLHYGGNNLSLSPLDLVKIGALVLQRGRWSGRQVVSEEWLERSLRPSGLHSTRRVDDYGLLWWLRPETGNPMAVGYGGQLLYIDRARRAVVVLTATLDSKGRQWEAEWLSWIETELEPALAATDERLVELAQRLRGRESPLAID